MRWWLAILFALIAAVTAVAVAYVSTVRSERALRDRAEETAAGTALWAALAVRDARPHELTPLVEELSEERRVALFVFGERGVLLTQPESFGVDVADVPNRRRALEEAEQGRRFLATLPEAEATVVALPLSQTDGAEALLAYAPRPEYGTSIGVLRGEIARSALIAILIGAAVGLIVAYLIARRLRRIAAVAAEIEAGRFDDPLRPVFLDEVGDLTATVDRMRTRLQASFDELRSERDQLSRLLKRLHEGVIAVNRELEVVVWNPPAARALGQTSLLEGEPLPEPWPDFSLRDLASGLFDSGAGIVEVRASRDRDRTYLITGIPAGPDSDTAVLVLADVSERERREQAEREFVTNAAHDLRTPLQTILGAVEVLQKGAKDSPRDRDRFLGHIERESTRLARLVRALLVLARAQTGVEAARVESFRLRPLLDDVVAGLKPRSDVDVSVRCPSDLTVEADSDLMEEALFNLAKNAAEHTEHGRIDLKARAHGTTVVIEVTDTGPGIPFEKQERVLDRFYRGTPRDADGFGLGLAIAHQAVSALGGALEVKSAPGSGTTARVELPASAPSREVA
jgi:signal transduction histidine kinase/HAMP domain-containing protein